MKSKKVRNIKVISQNGRNYKPMPTIILKGQRLNEMGFEIGDQIKIECEHGKLVISLDRERMELLDAERAFMETEIKKLQIQFQKEKEEIVVLPDAPGRSTWGAREGGLRMFSTEELESLDRSYFSVRLLYHCTGEGRGLGLMRDGGS